jgi:hypothetical protein
MAQKNSTDFLKELVLTYACVIDIVGYVKCSFVNWQQNLISAFQQSEQ